MRALMARDISLAMSPFPTLQTELDTRKIHLLISLPTGGRSDLAADDDTAEHITSNTLNQLHLCLLSSRFVDLEGVRERPGG